MRVGLNAEPLFQRIPTGVGVYALALCRGLVEIGHADDLVLFHADHDEAPSEVDALPVDRVGFTLSRDRLYDAWMADRRPAPQSITGDLDVVHSTGPAIPPSGGVRPRRDRARPRPDPLRRPLSRAGPGPSTSGRPHRRRRSGPHHRPVPLHRPRRRGVLRRRTGTDPGRAPRRRLRRPRRATRWATPASAGSGGGSPSPTSCGSAPRSSARTSSPSSTPSPTWPPATRTVPRPPRPQRLAGRRGGGGPAASRAPRPDDRQRGVACPATSWPPSTPGPSVFVYPSLYEGFGMPVLEAMACGTPVVTSNISALPETAGDAALLVDPLDDLALAEAISRIIEDPSWPRTSPDGARSGPGPSPGARPPAAPGPSTKKPVPPPPLKRPPAGRRSSSTTTPGPPLVACVASVLAQDRRPELVVVDNASTDGSLDGAPAGPSRRAGRAVGRQPGLRPGRQPRHRRHRRPGGGRPQPRHRAGPRRGRRPGGPLRRRSGPRRRRAPPPQPRRHRLPVGPADPQRWSTPSATASCSSSGGTTRSPAATGRRAPTRPGPGTSTGCRGRPSGSAGRPSTPSAGGTSATSCTSRTSTSAGGSGGPAGGWPTSPDRYRRAPPRGQHRRPSRTG